MSIARDHHRFSIADYDQMIDLGILTGTDRVELIHGEIVEKMSIGEFHAACVRRLSRLLGICAGERASVSVQSPVKLADSVPEPDIALIAPRDDDYATSHPGPKDVLLIVEVSDTSLEFDRDVKAPLYAENGIVEFWIINVLDRSLVVHRQPETSGQFREVVTLRGDESTTIALLPGMTIRVSEIFPPTGE